MNSVRRLPSVLMNILVLALLLQIGTGTMSARSSEPFKVVVAVNSDVDTLFPINEPNNTLPQHFNVFEQVVERDESLNVVPSLAESWELVDENTWRFVLRQGVKFHNGDTMTAEDVKFSLEYALNEGHESGPRKTLVGWFEGVDVIDDYTIEIRTAGAFPAMWDRLASAHYIIPKKYFEEVGLEEFQRNPVGTGPFYIEEYRRNQVLRLRAFDDYWGGRPEVDILEFRVMPEAASAVASLITGEVDVVMKLPVEYEAQVKAAGMNVYSVPGVTITYVGIDTKTPPFDNQLVREALSYALDIEAMTVGLMEGHATRANSVVQSSSFGWNPNLKPYEYNPRKARELLAAAGYPNGFNTVIDLNTQQWPKHQEIAELMVHYLADVGIHADLRVREWADFFERYRAGEANGLHLWGNTTYHALEHIRLIFLAPEHGGRGLYYSEPDTDDLILRAARETDPRAELEYYAEFQTLMRERVGAIPLWQYNEVVGVNPRIEWMPRGDDQFRGAVVKKAK